MNYSGIDLHSNLSAPGVAKAGPPGRCRLLSFVVAIGILRRSTDGQAVDITGSAVAPNPRRA
jgi:hypothetical protein